MISVQRSPVSKTNIVTKDYEVLFHPYLEDSPFSSIKCPLHNYLNSNADMNKYKNINTPKFAIGFIESAKVSIIFLNFSQSLISLNILKRRKALIIAKFKLPPFIDVPISTKLISTTNESNKLNLSFEYLTKPYPNNFISISKVKNPVNI